MVNFIKNKNIIRKALLVISKFSLASGFSSNMTKCEILPLYSCQDIAIENIPVKSKLFYLSVTVQVDGTTSNQSNIEDKINHKEKIPSTTG